MAGGGSGGPGSGWTRTEKIAFWALIVAFGTLIVTLFIGLLGFAGQVAQSEIRDILGLPKTPSTPAPDKASNTSTPTIPGESSPTPTETAPLPETVSDACHPNPSAESERERFVGAWFWQYNGSGVEDPSEIYMHLKADGSLEAQNDSKPRIYRGAWDYTQEGKLVLEDSSGFDVIYRGIEWTDNNNKFQGTLEKTPLDNEEDKRMFSRVPCRNLRNN